MYFKKTPEGRFIIVGNAFIKVRSIHRMTLVIKSPLGYPQVYNCC